MRRLRARLPDAPVEVLPGVPALVEALTNDSEVALGREVSIFRLAGDEFAIILADADSVARIESFAQGLLALIAEPMTLAERSICASGSVGIALYPDHADNVEDLLKNADAALYVAKDLGRARYVFYESSFSSEADRSHKIEQELRTAISRSELVLHYQPKIDIETDTVAGFEALLRGRDARQRAGECRFRR